MAIVACAVPSSFCFLVLADEETVMVDVAPDAMKPVVPTWDSIIKRRKLSTSMVILISYVNN